MQQSINIVAVGVYRHVAAHLETLFRPPYQLAAILDIHSSPQPFTYSPHNLGTVLHALLPRPQVIITGLAIPDGMTEECIEVWDSYVKSMNVEKALVINVNISPGALSRRIANGVQVAR